jgi:hypothetical protein
MGIREETFYEGGPHIGDLLFNIFLGTFVIFIPLTERSGCGSRSRIGEFP